MGWAVGFDENWKRDVGYGVPAICDDPSCDEEINRGLAHCCGGEPYGGEKGCGLHFCGKHLWYNSSTQLCHRCNVGRKPYTPKPDTDEWERHKLTDSTWQEWRQANPEWVAARAHDAPHPPPNPQPDQA